MSIENPKRIEKYLTKIYADYTEKRQRDKLAEIVERLNGKGILTREMLLYAAKTLRDQSKWDFAKVLAKFDMMDLEDRM